jgi:hypothetical protein
MIMIAILPEESAVGYWFFLIQKEMGLVFSILVLLFLSF